MPYYEWSPPGWPTPNSFYFFVPGAMSYPDYPYSPSYRRPLSSAWANQAAYPPGEPMPPFGVRQFAPDDPMVREATRRWNEVQRPLSPSWANQAAYPPGEQPSSWMSPPPPQESQRMGFPPDLLDRIRAERPAQSGGGGYYPDRNGVYPDGRRYGEYYPPSDPDVPFDPATSGGHVQAPAGYYPEMRPSESGGAGGWFRYDADTGEVTPISAEEAAQRVALPPRPAPPPQRREPPAQEPAPPAQESGTRRNWVFW